MSDWEDINKAWDIVRERIDRGEASPGDRAVYEVLGTSAFRLVPGGTYSRRDCDVVESIQRMLAYTVNVAASLPTKCERCGVPFKLLSECEECKPDDDD
jgi:Fe-S oxidoreductase